MTFKKKFAAILSVNKKVLYLSHANKQKFSKMNVQQALRLNYNDVEEAIKSTNERIDLYSNCKGKNDLKVIRRIYELQNLRTELIKVKKERVLKMKKHLRSFR